MKFNRKRADFAFRCWKVYTFEFENFLSEMEIGPEQPPGSEWGSTSVTGAQFSDSLQYVTRPSSHCKTDLLSDSLAGANPVVATESLFPAGRDRLISIAGISRRFQIPRPLRSVRAEIAVA
jgi:hypothetical protein